MFFKDLVGQNHIHQKLINSVLQGRISHAQLFAGPAGSGALLAAIAYCRFVACENKGGTDACGSCPSCKKFDQLSHPDLHFSFPIQLSKGTRVSEDVYAQWKNWLPNHAYSSLPSWMRHIESEGKQGVIATDESTRIVKRLLLKSYEGGFKFLILWLPELLNISAANKLLKLIEEPPNNTLFIFVSENPERILPTIYSRTQRISFAPLSEKAIESELIKIGADEKAAKDISFLAEGNWGVAKQQWDKTEEGQPMFEIFRHWMRLCFAKSVSELVTWVETLDKSGRETQKQFLEFALKVFREALWMSYTGKEVQKETEQGVFLVKFAPYINERNALEMVSEMEKAIGHIGRNANGKILFLDLTFKVIILLKK